MGLANRGRDPGPVARSDRREGRAGGLEGWRAESSGSSWRRRWLFVICSAAQKKPTTDEARQSLERCCRQGTGTLLVSSRRTKQEYLRVPTKCLVGLWAGPQQGLWHL